MQGYISLITVPIPILDTDGKPLMEADARGRQVAKVIQPNECFFTIKAAYEKYASLYKEQERDRNTKLGKVKFAMQLKRILGPDNYHEKQASTDIGPNKARPSNYYLTYNLARVG